MTAAPRRLGARLRSAWRGSLQVRVVSLTLVLGLVVVSVTGAFIYRGLADGLVGQKRIVASAEALRMTKEVQDQFQRTDLVQTQEEITQAAQNMVYASATSDGSRMVVLRRSDDNHNAVVVPTFIGGDVTEAEIPDALRATVDSDPGSQQEQIVTLTLHEVCSQSGVCQVDNRSSPAWVIGQQVVLPLAGTYQLYFVYPFQTEAATLDLASRILLYGGLAIVAMLGAVAWLVTRMVVDPVRRASRVAERLAAGRLNERMRIRGDDEIASLAQSFNRMAASLQQQIGQLENLSNVQQRFVSDVSHELRTPLTTIRMAGDLLYDLRADFGPVVGRSAELLHDELDRFEELLADLLEISRFDAGAAALDLDEVDLRTCVTRAVAAVSTLAERKGTVIRVLGGEEPALATADARRVERVLRNLLGNAVEHGEGRSVEVTIGQNESAVAVSVRDHGVGLRPGESGMVFSRFWRADPARARTTGGTGLGLAISKEDALLHAGWLQAWGVRGEGACFRLTLPRVAGGTIDTSPVPLNPVVSVTR